MKKILASISILFAFWFTMASPASAAVAPDTNPTCNEDVASVLRLYESYFNRAPDVPGAEYWTNIVMTGQATVPEIAEWFAQGVEAQALFAGKTDAQFVWQVYENVLNRQPDTPGFNYWLDLLQTGQLERSEVVYWVSFSVELQGRIPYAPGAICELSDNPNYTLADEFQKATHYVSNDGNVHVAFIQSGDIETSPGSSLRTPGYYGGTIAINGNWFGGPNTFYGHSISNGTLLGHVGGDYRIAHVGSDFFGDYVVNYTGGNNDKPVGITNAVSGKLIVAGGSLWPDTTTATPDPALSSRHPRTAAGVTADGLMVLVTVDGRNYGPGMTATELGNLLISLGVEDGVVLDGGGSTAMYVTGSGIVNDPSDGSPRAVRNQLIFTAGSSWVS